LEKDASPLDDLAWTVERKAIRSGKAIRVHPWLAP
jgi:hypothetical protein